MDRSEAQSIKNDYNRYDEEFRAAKKRGDYKKASQWKDKRDALAGKLNDAIKVLQS